MAKTFNAEIDRPDGALITFDIVAGDASSTTATANASPPATMEFDAHSSVGTLRLRGDGKQASFSITNLRIASEGRIIAPPLPALATFTPGTWSKSDAATQAFFNGSPVGICSGQMWESLAPGALQPDAYRNLRPNARDAAILAQVGFGVVRISFCPSWVTPGAADGNGRWIVSAATLNNLAATVDQYIAAGLKVILVADHHNWGLSAMNASWATQCSSGFISDADVQPRTVDMVAQVVERFVGTSYTHLAIELENEPHVGSAATGGNPGMTDARWAALLPTLYAAARAKDPNRILGVGGTDSNACAKLSVCAPFFATLPANSKVFAVVHPYLPFGAFTHTGKVSQPYWNAAKKAVFDADFALGLAAAQSAGLILASTEVGARPFVPHAHMAAYIRDVSNTLNAAGVARTWWNLDGDFGWYMRTRGKFRDGYVPAALGGAEPVLSTGANRIDPLNCYWVHSGTGVTHVLPPAADGTITFPTAGDWKCHYLPIRGPALENGQSLALTIEASATTTLKLNWRWVSCDLMSPLTTEKLISAGADESGAGWANYYVNTTPRALSLPVAHDWLTEPRASWLEPTGLGIEVIGVTAGRTLKLTAPMP